MCYAFLLAFISVKLSTVLELIEQWALMQKSQNEGGFCKVEMNIQVFLSVSLSKNLGWSFLLTAFSLGDIMTKLW